MRRGTSAGHLADGDLDVRRGWIRRRRYGESLFDSTGSGGDGQPYQVVLAREEFRDLGQP
jgi:hypothetical protein